MWRTERSRRVRMSPGVWAVDGARRTGLHPPERGQSTIEYGLLVSLVSLGAIAVLVLFYGPLKEVFSRTLSLVKYAA